MGQTYRRVFRTACFAGILATCACSAGPTEPARDPGSSGLRRSTVSAAPATPRTSGVFIGGGMAAPADSTSEGRGVFIGGGM